MTKHFPYLNKFKKSTEILKKIAEDAFNQNHYNKNSENILGILVSAVKDETMDRKEAEGQILNLLVAGHDTSATTLVWTLSHLSKSPDTWELIKKESIEVFKHENSEDFVKKIMNAEITGKVIDEALRLYPAVWGTTRTAIKDVEIDNVFVKQKTIVLTSAYVSHRNPKYFYNPEEFIPERWHDGFKESLDQGVYFPFYMGQKKCLGDRFATLEMKIILLLIANKMSLSLNSKFPEPHFSTLLKIKNKVLMNIEMRKNEKLD